MKKFKTPLRYPGGKSRATKFLFSRDNMPERKIKEYREPFIGGGSPAVAFAKANPDTPIWINDLYYNLYCFWHCLQNDGKRLHETVLNYRSMCSEIEDARKLFQKIKEDITEQTEPFNIAWRMYIINRCSFSGLTESSSFSAQASTNNWTLPTINSLPYYTSLIKNWKITNLDYSELLTDDEDTFIFLDPPYDLKKDYTISGVDGESLYGKKGSMHKGFNHVEFSRQLSNHKAMMMVTYNSNENIRNLFSGWNQKEWDLTYTMRTNTDKYNKAQKDRKELLCINYDTGINTLEDFFE